VNEPKVSPERLRLEADAYLAEPGASLLRAAAERIEELERIDAEYLRCSRRGADIEIALASELAAERAKVALLLDVIDLACRLLPGESTAYSVLDSAANRFRIRYPSVPVSVEGER
jgi:hypothetical protein